MFLDDLLSPLLLTELPTGVMIHQLCLDSRRVQAGDLFFACKGAHTHAREFIAEAIAQGASAVCVEVEAYDVQAISFVSGVPVIPVVRLSQELGKIAALFYGNPSEHLKIVGVTGTNGKSSICFLLVRALNQLGCRAAMIGTLGLGFPEALDTSSLTTPDPITLQKTLARFLKQGAKVVAMEVSSHALDQYRVDGLHFELGVFTNLTRDHLDYHSTMAAYGLAKEQLFHRLKPRVALLNIDDSYVRALVGRLDPSIQVHTYATQSKQWSSLHADHIHYGSEGLKADVKTPWGELQVVTRLIGRFNINNLLAVIGALGVLGYQMDQIKPVLARLPCVPGRMEVFSMMAKPTVVVDYSHTPGALEKVLEELKALCRGKLFCVFGCGGERDRGKRPMMAAVAAQFSDEVIVTNDNPRHEDPQAIIDEIILGFGLYNAWSIEKDRVRAIENTIRKAGAEDVILVAGKGHELNQLIGDVILPFNDANVVRACLEKNS